MLRVDRRTCAELPAQATPYTQILSVVCALTAPEVQSLAPIIRLHEELARLDVPTELVIVLNGSNAEAVSTLRELTEQCETAQIYITRGRVDHSTAVMAGLENAVGDWIATIDVAVDDPCLIRSMFDAVRRERAEMALTVPVNPRRSLADAVLSWTFHRLFRTLHGFSLDIDTPSARLLSRSVVKSLLSDDSPLIAFDTLNSRTEFRRCVVPCARTRGTRRRLREKVRLRWRTLIGIDAAPLRLANLVAAMAALGALSYSLYVTLIYLIKGSELPGWTTLSLMLSGMFMMLALVLWLLSEYMLILLDPGARRPCYEIIDEFGGHAKVGERTLNVEAEL